MYSYKGFVQKEQGNVPEIFQSKNLVNSKLPGQYSGILTAQQPISMGYFTYETQNKPMFTFAPRNISSIPRKMVL